MDVALLITAIGMSLVFAAILLIWLLITLIVRFTARFSDEAAAAVDEAAAPVPDVAETERKRRAALAAVAFALAEGQQQKPNVPATPPMRFVSAWQVAMRTHNMSLRKPR